MDEQDRLKTQRQYIVWWRKAWK